MDVVYRHNNEHAGIGLEKYCIDEEDMVSKQGYFSHVLQCRRAVISMILGAIQVKEQTTYGGNGDTRNMKWQKQIK